MREYFDQGLWASARRCALGRKILGALGVFFALAAICAACAAVFPLSFAPPRLAAPLAALCAALSILLALAAACFGRRHARILHALGLARIFRARRKNGRSDIWCAVPDASYLPKPGNVRMVLSPAGALVGEARAENARGASLRLTMLDDAGVPVGSLVCLRPPHTRPKSL